MSTMQVVVNNLKGELCDGATTKHIGSSDSFVVGGSRWCDAFLGWGAASTPVCTNLRVTCASFDCTVVPDCWSKQYQVKQEAMQEVPRDIQRTWYRCFLVSGRTTSLRTNFRGSLWPVMGESYFHSTMAYCNWCIKGVYANRFAFLELLFGLSAGGGINIAPEECTRSEPLLL
jgi:hypothetical protein